jgi:hypothetical protein
MTGRRWSRIAWRQTLPFMLDDEGQADSHSPFACLVSGDLDTFPWFLRLRHLLGYHNSLRELVASVWKLGSQVSSPGNQEGNTTFDTKNLGRLDRAPPLPKSLPKPGQAQLKLSGRSPVRPPTSLAQQQINLLPTFFHSSISLIKAVTSCDQPVDRLTNSRCMHSMLEKLRRHAAEYWGKYFDL